MYQSNDCAQDSKTLRASVVKSQQLAKHHLFSLADYLLTTADELSILSGSQPSIRKHYIPDGHEIISNPSR